MTQWGIDALFNPGKRHMDEEKRRLQSTRQEIGDSSGGKRIDLGSGKVTLTGKPKKDAEVADAEDADVSGALVSDADVSDADGSDAEDSDDRMPAGPAGSAGSAGSAEE